MPTYKPSPKAYLLPWQAQEVDIEDWLNQGEEDGGGDDEQPPVPPQTPPQQEAPPTPSGQYWEPGQPPLPMPDPASLPTGFRYTIGSAVMPFMGQDAAGNVQSGQKIVYFWEPAEATKANIVSKDHVDPATGQRWEVDYQVNPDGTMTPVPGMSSRLIELGPKSDPEEPDIFSETYWDNDADQAMSRQYILDRGPNGEYYKRYITEAVPSGPRRDVDLSRERFEYEKQQDTLAQEQRQSELAASSEERQTEREWQAHQDQVQREWEERQAATRREDEAFERRRQEQREFYYDPILKNLARGGFAPWETTTGQAQAPEGELPFMYGTEAGRRALAERMWQAGLTAPGTPENPAVQPWIDVDGTRRFSSAYTPGAWADLLTSQKAKGNLPAAMPQSANPWYNAEATGPRASSQSFMGGNGELQYAPHDPFAGDIDTNNFEDIRDRLFRSGAYTSAVAPTAESNRVRVNAFATQEQKRKEEANRPAWLQETARARGVRRF